MSDASPTPELAKDMAKLLFQVLVFMETSSGDIDRPDNWKQWRELKAQLHHVAAHARKAGLL